MPAGDDRGQFFLPAHAALTVLICMSAFLDAPGCPLMGVPPGFILVW